jgi:hypothetical protein
MRLRTRKKLLRRLLFAAMLAVLLYSGAATRPAAAQYPYGRDCTKL